LMVMMAVDNPVVCASVATDGRDCTDQVTTIQKQLAAAYAMQDYIDADGGGNGAGWYRIVTTPAEARAVVARGQLAVVLGVETANPPLWGDVRGASWLRANGVRHVFPIHVADNDLGGASYFQPKIQHQANNPNDSGAKAHWVTQRYDLTTMECPQYELASDPTSAIVSLNTGACNVKGLTDAGKAAVEQLMRAGLIIDVDHMSDRSFADTLTIAEKNGYPVVASHAGFNTRRSVAARLISTTRAFSRSGSCLIFLPT
jgi:microsomal dipeptidase-like Zn-dependent dipeptidase